MTLLKKILVLHVTRNDENTQEIAVEMTKVDGVGDCVCRVKTGNLQERNRSDKGRCHKEVIFR
jgi:hypothetical protein